GAYMFTLEPSPGDQAAMPVLRSFIPIPMPTLRLLAGNKYSYPTQAGFVYQAQTSSSALGPWTNSGSAITSTGQTVTNTMTIAPGAVGLFRVRISRAP